MNAAIRFLSAVLCLALLALCCALPVASAGGGADVWVNNVWLNSVSPYWKNGNAPASAGDWNAFYDAASSTLTLKDAVINTLSDPTVDSMYQALVYADGNLTVLLEGNCDLSYDGSGGSNIIGIFASGTLTVSGNGGATIRITAADNQTVQGLCGKNALTVKGGALDLLLTSSTTTSGFASDNAILFSGGSAVAICNGLYARVFSVAYGTLRITGGGLKAIARAPSAGYAIAVMATSAYLEGGEGILQAAGGEVAYGFLVGEFTLIVTGGNFAVSGTTAAVYPMLFSNLQLTRSSMYGSENSTGIGLRLLLPGRSTMQAVPLSGLSSYRYLRFTADTEMPRTGDSSMPGLWAGIALCALTLGGWICAKAVRLRRRTGG